MIGPKILLSWTVLMRDKKPVNALKNKGLSLLFLPNPTVYSLGFMIKLPTRRNDIERLFTRLKAFRRLFSRVEKLDLMFTAFVHRALMMEMIK